MTAVNENNKEDNSVIEDFQLYQNSPNPFNSETIIKYYLRNPSEANIKVFNLLGQEVKTLVNEKRSAGYHNVKWDGTNYNGIKVNSGVYIYRIQAGDFVQTKKMVLLK